MWRADAAITMGAPAGSGRSLTFHRFTRSARREILPSDPSGHSRWHRRRMMEDRKLWKLLPKYFESASLSKGPKSVMWAMPCRAELTALDLGQTIQPGQSVAITAGSRGIHQIDAILRAVVEFLGGLGAEPFIVPAMGSHGGGDGGRPSRSPGQVWASPRVSVGCPIRASMETVVVCEAAEGFPVHFDRLAFEADHVLVCNRVKPHTGFTGDICRAA